MNKKTQSSRAARSGAFILHPSAFILLLLTGCQAITDPLDTQGANRPQMYTGLAGQSAGVMVWADRGVRIDWQTIQLDLASRVQEILSKSKAEEVKGTTWPVLAASIVRYQRDHPGIEASPITDVAPRLGVSRLIYIEIESFTTRSDATVQMFRGKALATLKVIEVTDGQAKVAFEEKGIRATFPPRTPPEGVLNSSDLAMYRGTLSLLAEQIARRVAKIED